MKPKLMGPDVVQGPVLLVMYNSLAWSSVNVGSGGGERTLPMVRVYPKLKQVTYKLLG